jgi:hypothetical protein
MCVSVTQICLVCARVGGCSISQVCGVEGIRSGYASRFSSLGPERRARSPPPGRDGFAKVTSLFMWTPRCCCRCRFFRMLRPKPGCSTRLFTQGCVRAPTPLVRLPTSRYPPGTNPLQGTASSASLPSNNLFFVLSSLLGYTSFRASCRSPRIRPARLGTHTHGSLMAIPYTAHVPQLVTCQGYRAGSTGWLQTLSCEKWRVHAACLSSSQWRVDGDRVARGYDLADR